MSENLNKLTRNELQEVIDFSRGLAIADQIGYYSPSMQNSILNSLNNNPKIPKLEQLKKALSNYKNQAKDLQDYTEFMSHWDMLFARTVESYANILSFDLQVVCTNAYTKAEYESDAYKADKRKVDKFLDAFDYVAEFRKVAKQVLIHQTYYTWFRRSKWGNKGMRGNLQIMPQNYCKLTGYFEKGYLYDFDTSYFLQAGTNIDGYDPIFKKYFNEVYGNKEKEPYDPSAPLNKRDGVYNTFVQTSPTDGAWAWRFDASDFNDTPFLAPLIKSGLRNEEIEQLQYNKDMISAYAILAGEMRLFDNAKSGTVANQFAIDPKVLGGFMAKVKQGLSSSIKAVAMPTENTDMYQYNDTNKDMYKNQLESFAGMGSGVGRVLFSADRMSNAELQYAVEAQYQIMKKLYSQFQNFMDFYVNMLTKKYHFRFIFDGCAYEFEREKRFDRLMKMADKGIVLNSSAYASALGMAPQDFERSLRESHNNGWLDNLSMLLNANTMKDGGEGGRPRTGDASITDSGEASRENLDS